MYSLFEDAERERRLRLFEDTAETFLRLSTLVKCVPRDKWYTLSFYGSGSSFKTCLLLTKDSVQCCQLSINQTSEKLCLPLFLLLLRSFIFIFICLSLKGMLLAQWLKHPISVWKVTGSITVGDLDFFICPTLVTTENVIFLIVLFIAHPQRFTAWPGECSPLAKRVCRKSTL